MPPTCSSRPEIRDHEVPQKRSDSMIDRSRRALAWIARALVLICILYAAWHYGATEPVAQRNLALLVGVASLFTLAAYGEKVTRVSRVPIWCLLPPLCFILYGIVQSGPAPPVIFRWFSANDAVIEVFARQPGNELGHAIVALGGDRVDQPTSPQGSLMPHETRLALVPIILAVSILWLVSILFTTERTRVAFLWCLIAHTALFCVWGIIQRSAGSGDLLPGIPNPSRGIPFGSFVYRNAGAAAIFPGLAAAIALLIARRPPAMRAVGSIRLENRRGGMPGITDLSLISLAALITTGLVFSLSRGAWIAATFALLLTAVVCRRRLRWGGIALAATALMILASLVGPQISRPLIAKLDRISPSQIALDQRWLHWRDGWVTATAHFPCGSGLGTYGHATLLNQSGPRRAWFREAHNQYLEVLVESGIIGITIVIGMIGFTGNAAIRLVHRDLAPHRGHASIKTAVGLTTMMTLIFASVQSAVDFTIAIPANTILYAALIGLLAAVDRTPPGVDRKPQGVDRKPQGVDRKPQGVDRKPQGFEQLIGPPDPRDLSRSLPSLWRYPTAVGLIMGGAIWAYRTTNAEVRGSAAIAMASLSTLQSGPAEALLRDRLEILDAAVAAQPDRSALRRYRAVHHLAHYRIELLRRLNQSGTPALWEHTEPSYLFAHLMAMQSADRQTATAALASAEGLQQPMLDAFADLHAGISVSPLDFALQVLGAKLSPLHSHSPENWIRNASKLSRNDPKKLFSMGWLAYHCGMTETMVDQWSESIQLSESYEATIFGLALKRLDPLVLGSNLVPPEKPEVMVRLVRHVLTPSDGIPDIRLTDGEKIAAEMAESLFRKGASPNARQHASAGSIHELIGDFAGAAEHWLAAVEMSPSSAKYRFRAADNLFMGRRTAEAIRQLRFGSALDPTDPRSEQLLIRHRDLITTDSM